MYYQMSAMSKMGTLEKLMSLIPGMSDMGDKVDYEATQQRLTVFKIIMDSMTEQEKDDPSIIKSKRIDRIADGAGVTNHDVKELLKQYNQSSKMMKSVGKDRKMRKQLMKQMGGIDLDSLKELQGSE
jgi:signal recognition particle subunit SRP54